MAVTKTTAITEVTGGSVLPSHVAGDMLLGWAIAKPSTIAAMSINSGWTVLLTGTGGTGTSGNDVGQIAFGLFAKVATSSSETVPTITMTGATVAVVQYVAYRPDSGRTWLDAVATTPAWVRGGSDVTTTASGLTINVGTFTTVPTTDDALVFFGGTPSDSSVQSGTPLSVTYSGLSGGTLAAEDFQTSTGQDLSAHWGHWLGFTGTGSGDITPAFNFSASSNSGGPVVAVALRQTSASIDLTGAVTTTNPTAAGSLTGYNASELSGAVTTTNPTASGSLTAASPSLTGAATTVNPTASGSLNSTADNALTGTTTTVNPTASGVLSGFLSSDLAGAVTTTNPTVAGSLSVESVADLSGSVTTTNPTASGALELGAAFTCLDIDTEVVDSGTFTTITGGEIVPTAGTRVDFILSLPVFEYGHTYEVRLAFDGGDWAEAAPHGSVFMYLVDSLDPDLVTDYIAVGTFDGPQDSALVVYPLGGTDVMNAAITAGFVYLNVSGPRSSTVTAVCWRELAQIVDDAPVFTDTDLVGTDPVDQGEWDAEWHDTVAVTPLPLVGMWQADDVAFVLDGSGAKIEKRRTRLRDRIVMGGVDITFVNGKRTHVPDFQRMKPFSFGPGSLSIPGINPLLDDLSSYAWLTPWAKVRVERVDADDVVQVVDWRGRGIAWDVSGAELTVDLGGMFTGPAAVHWRPKAPIRRRADSTYWVHAMLRKNQQPDDYDAEDEFGVTLTTPPQGWHLQCALDTVASSVKRDGTALTYWYDEDAHMWAHGPVDRETIHATVYADHGHTRLEVTRDHSADKNQIFASGYDEDGGKIAFYVAPGMQEVAAEDRPYPLASGDPFGIGTLDSATTDGAGISRLIYRLMVFKFLKRDNKSGGFDADVEEAVTDARVKAKLDNYGSGDPILQQVDEDLWNWLWDDDGAGFTMKEARQEPAYEVRQLGKYLFGATGQLLGLNPDYDASVLPVSDVVDYSTRMHKGQMIRRSKRLVESGPNWSGTLTMQHGLIAGEHNPGDAFDVADIISNRDVREGWNVWVPNFDGGTLFHVSGVDVSDDGFVTRFMVDTRARDTLTLNAILDRQEQNRISPAKAFWRQHSGHFTKDAVTGFLGDDIGGRLSSDRLLTGGEWTVIDVPLGDYGLVQRFRTRVRQYVSDIEDGLGEGSTNHDGADGLEHYVRVFGEKVTAGFMNAREPDPSADGAKAAFKGALSEYKGRGMLAAYGAVPGAEEPCGYGDFDSAEGDLTGNFFDDSGFPFRAPDCKAYVAVWVPEDALQLAGWMFRWQVDEGT